jgi:hypothetical protein
MSRRQFLVQLAAGTISLILPGCAPTAKEREKMTKLLEAMQTHFVGRMLIDLPSGFGSQQGNDVELIYGLDTNWRSIRVEILATGANHADLAQEITKQSTRLLANQHTLLHVPMLVKQITLSKDAILLRSYDDSLVDDAFRHELFVRIDDVVVRATDSSYQQPVEKIEARLIKLGSQMSRPADPMKAGRGFFLGPLLIDSDQDSENGGFSFYSKEFPDVHWEILTQAIAPNEETLLRRWDKKKGIIEAAGQRSNTVRRGKTRIAEMEAEELLQKIKVLGQPSLYFSAESIRSTPGLAKPLFSIDLGTGAMDAPNEESAMPSSWSVDEATAVWDAVIKSIRLRPGAV